MTSVHYGSTLESAAEAYGITLRRFMRTAERTPRANVKPLRDLLNEINRTLPPCGAHHKVIAYHYMAQTARMLLTLPQSWSGQLGQERTQIAQLHQSACTKAELFLSRLEEIVPMTLCRYTALEAANLG